MPGTTSASSLASGITLPPEHSALYFAAYLGDGVTSDGVTSDSVTSDSVAADGGMVATALADGQPE
ncbi:MAG TPA: hypothetical protein VME19_07110 [Streptosporangiaceae bacterium]|nr:hypothetical protein [Streptosporangiaceae bacterium]